MKSSKTILPNKTLHRWILFGSFIGAFFIVLFRAYSLSFTHDESISYAILLGDKGMALTANNHWLNTQLMNGCRYLFGNSEFSLRLPNVLFFGMYLFGCFQLLKQAKWWIMLLGVALLVYNPYLLDYFSLARGYGISLGSLMMALVFYLQPAITTQHFLKNSTLSLFFAAVALLANFATINVLISMIGIVVLKALFNKKYKWSRKSILTFMGLLLLSTIPILFALQRLFLLKETGELYFGSPSLDFSLRSFILCSTELLATDGAFVVKYLLIGLFLSGITYLVFTKNWKGQFAGMVILFAWMFIGYGLEFVLFDVLLPMERTTIHFIPLVALFIYLLLIEWNTYHTSMKRVQWVASSFLVIILVFNFARSLDMKATKTWKFDQNTKDVALYLQQMNDPQNFTISNNWLFEPTLNYYIERYHLPCQKASHGAIVGSDFLFEFDNQYNASGYEKKVHFESIQATLYQKKNLKVGN